MQNTTEKRMRQCKCAVCGESCNGLKQLRLHMTSHPDVKVNICNVCGKDFTTKDALNKHYRIHTGEKRYMCETCGMVLSDHASFKRHVLRHAGERKYICKICHKGFVTNSNLAVHKKTHSETKSHICSFCKRGFNFKGSLRKHIQRIHTVEKLDICCVLSEDGALILKKKTADSDQHYMCNPCNEGYTHRDLFKNHVLQHEALKKFCCSICDEEFATDIDLEWHIHYHAGAELHTCVICNRKFLEKYALKNHMSVHLQEKSRQCKHCGEKVSANLLHVCEKTQHPYKCNQCLQVYQEKYQLDRHLKYHNLTSSHICGYCGWSFTRKDNLEVHAKGHIKKGNGSLASTDEESLIQERHCNNCDQTFAYGCHHECKGKHDYAYTCSECSEQFCDKSLLVTHMKYHDKDRPFVCGYCGWRFARKCNLTKHTIWHKKVEERNGEHNEKDVDDGTTTSADIENGNQIHQCSECGEESAYGVDHVCNGNQTHQCSKCGEESAYGVDHVCNGKQTYAFPCTECHESYQEESLLENHMKYHDMDRLFVCTYCGWRFVRNCNLIRHMKWHIKLDKEAMDVKKEDDCDQSAPIKQTLNNVFPSLDVKEAIVVGNVKSEIDVGSVTSGLCANNELDIENIKREDDSILISSVEFVQECNYSERNPLKVEPDA